jgi:hypothetical protein
LFMGKRLAWPGFLNEALVARGGVDRRQIIFGDVRNGEVISGCFHEVRDWRRNEGCRQFLYD